jgi:hypothetical protein
VSASSTPWGKYLRDTIIFLIGIGIVVGETGFPFLVDRPPQGPSVLALVTGALFCNGPVVLQALAIRFGTSGSQGSQGSPDPQSQPQQSSGSS